MFNCFYVVEIKELKKKIKWITCSVSRRDSQKKRLKKKIAEKCLTAGWMGLQSATLSPKSSIWTFDVPLTENSIESNFSFEIAYDGVMHFHVQNEVDFLAKDRFNLELCLVVSRDDENLAFFFRIALHCSPFMFFPPCWHLDVSIVDNEGWVLFGAYLSTLVQVLRLFFKACGRARAIHPYIESASASLVIHITTNSVKHSKPRMLK